jgi:hypothetical protein
MPTNPLHDLIDQLSRFIPPFWDCHHADTKEKKDQARGAWLAVTGPFWDAHRRPGEAVRALADPALAWCRRQGIATEQNIATVEYAADLITGLAMITVPSAQPHVYANVDEAREVWQQQGGLLMAAHASRDALRRLAALAGFEWHGDSKMHRESGSPAGGESVRVGVPQVPASSEQTQNADQQSGGTGHPPLSTDASPGTDIRLSRETTENILDRQRKRREQEEQRDLEAKHRCEEVQQERNRRQELQTAFAKLRSSGWWWGQQKDAATLTATGADKAQAWIAVLELLLELGHFDRVLDDVRNDASSFDAPEIADPAEREQEANDRRAFLLELLRADALFILGGRP